ncbi:carboxylesterase [Tersicoccus solisilvae]|uniref:Carboxylesterase n=1 Tax=Tersicoccus solisilvae TaxID=1882339 RepID=A0ABQ1PCR0_9MICC|nr:alpha/beta fold hydrolase [Tersicoccus solisilvae]GGC94678.1 carboxylesterase [Tersicoccus solisilvae]
MQATTDFLAFSRAGSGARASTGVVVSHGFTGSPTSVLPWARHLADAGFAVRVPLLEGHGTSWQQLNRTSWQQWYGSLVTAYHDLADQVEHVAVAGLSMGGTLALRLAAQYPVAGATLVNPAMTFASPAARWVGALKYVRRSLPAIGSDIKAPGVDEEAYPRTPLAATHELARLFAATLPLLPAVACPVQIFRSTEDAVVPDSSLTAITDGLPMPPEVVPLANSYHVATLDNDAPRILDASVRFLDACVRPGGRPDGPTGR